MKINLCKNHVLNFHDFIVQPGMILGYDEFNTPFVSNGRIKISDESIPIYFMTGIDPMGRNIWKSKRIKRYNRPELFDKIANKTSNRKASIQDGKMNITIVTKIQKNKNESKDTWVIESRRENAWIIDGVCYSKLHFRTAIEAREEHSITFPHSPSVGVQYQSKAQLESEFWGRKEISDGSIIHNGCRSNHYGFSTERRPKGYVANACYTGNGFAHDHIKYTR